MKPVIFHRKAIAELDHAVAYYENQRKGLGIDFLTKIDQSVNKIQQNPNLGAIYKQTELRRYIVQPFPFLIFYGDFEDFIWIVAIAHAKRRPDYWINRQI
jgi:toxin ParE1/3/4